MNIRFKCPACKQWTRTREVAAPDWACFFCGTNVEAAAPKDSPELIRCRLCGNHEFYVQKAFPHWLGMSIIVLASMGFLLSMARYRAVAAWSILIGSALLDVVLYLVMGNVTVCYRCLTEYRGFPPNPEHDPFDLSIGERHRQERIRRRQLKKKAEGDKQ